MPASLRSASYFMVVARPKAMKHETRQLAQAAKEKAPSHCRPHCWAGGNTCLYCGKVKRQKHTWGSIYRNALKRGDDHGYAAFLADGWEKRKAKKPKSKQAVDEAIHVAAGNGEGI